MTTPTERAILTRRRADESGGVLVPLLERLLEDEQLPETEEDFRFLDMLVRARALPRRKGVFSPSMLGSCQRQAWLAKRDTPKSRSRSSQMNGYFLTGNFVHLKWQFACWRLHKAGMIELVKVPIEGEYQIVQSLYKDEAISHDDAHAWLKALDFYGDDTRPGVEVRVVDGDFGGTIDVLAHVPTQETSFNTHVIDFKGVNQVDFMRAVKSGAKPEYRRQIVGYADVANKTLIPGTLSQPIESCLLVSENKSGPLGGRGSPLALHETLVPVEDHLGDVHRRLRTLRFYDLKNDMPAAECVSTLHMGYQECPFGHRFCKDEVLVSQREREQKARDKHKRVKVARSRRAKED